MRKQTERQQQVGMKGKTCEVLQLSHVCISIPYDSVRLFMGWWPLVAYSHCKWIFPLFLDLFEYAVAGSEGQWFHYFMYFYCYLLTLLSAALSPACGGKVGYKFVK